MSTIDVCTCSAAGPRGPGSPRPGPGTPGSWRRNPRAPAAGEASLEAHGGRQLTDFSVLPSTAPGSADSTSGELCGAGARARTALETGGLTPSFPGYPLVLIRTCRYAWLPKAFAAIDANHDAFADEETAMIRLGVGKNMVRAIRFWMLEMSVAQKPAGGGYEPSDFAKAIFSRKKGMDPFL